MMNDVVAVVGVVSGLLTIIAFFLPINSRRARWIHAAYILVVTASVAIAMYQSSKISRLNRISSAADHLVSSRQMNYTDRGYVFAVLAFLEKNKDLFPETYARALLTCKSFKCDDPNTNVDMVELSFAFDGIVKGLGDISR